MSEASKHGLATLPSPSADREILVRKAVMTDLGPLLRLINSYAAEGVMLPRTEFELSESIRDFMVAVAGAEVVGCGALHFFGPSIGEVRSLAVEPSSKSRGIGRRLVEALEAEARNHGLRSIFAFTYLSDFFARLGFVEVNRDELPLKVWKDCLRCPKFQCCDEIAVRKLLLDTPIRGDSGPGDSLHEEGIVLPTVRKQSEHE